MPRRPTATETRMRNVIECLEPVIPLLNDLSYAFGTPFLLAISNTTLSLITGIQSAKKHKEECIQFMEHIHQVLCALVNLHINSETPGSLSPASLDHVKGFMETIHKIHIFVEAQQDGNRIKNFFRQGEMNALLNDCRAGMHHALDVFKIQSEAGIVPDVKQMQDVADNMHKELLELVASLSDGTSSDRASSMYRIYRTLNSSQLRSADNKHLTSQSFSMLPAGPKIFHGRDSELEGILQMLDQESESARIAILGAAGMGKTSLATAVLHHPRVAAKYEYRLFVPCDSATNSIEVAAIIGAHLGLKPGKDLTKPVLRQLSERPSALLVLDNLETVWEPIESRSGVEELLSLLTDLPGLTLIITMRGAERPSKVRWTRPFLQPLKPLSADAARQTFGDIADGFHEAHDIDQLLHLTDNMPLAVALIAHLVDYEGCASVLARWETEKTSMLSAGYGRASDLDTSIGVSLLSPRFISSPGAMELLSLLSILPDGLSDGELLQSKLPIKDVLACKTTLLATSLAYGDGRRLKSLVPIREHMQKFHPPTPSLVQVIRKHFHTVLGLYHTYRGPRQTESVVQITPNVRNLIHVLRQELHADNSDLEGTIKCTTYLNTFSMAIGHGRIELMDQIPAVLTAEDHALQVHYITGVFNSLLYQAIPNPEVLASRALSHLQHVSNALAQAKLYRALGYYYTNRDNLPEGMKCLEKALKLARTAGDTTEQSQILNMLSSAKWQVAEYPAGRALAIESQRLSKLSANLYLEGQALWIEAGFWKELGDYKYTLFLLHSAREHLALCGMTGGNWDLAVMGTEADTYLLKSEYAEARAIHAEIRQNTSPEQDMFRHAFALLGIGNIDIILGLTGNDVEHNLERARTMLSSIGYLAGVTYCEMYLASLKLKEGDLTTAKEMFQKFLKWSWGKDAPVTSHCLQEMGDVVRWPVTDSNWTSAYTVVYLAFAQKSQQKAALHNAFRCLGDAFLLQGDEATAENLFKVALEGFTSMDVHHRRADCMLRLGDIMQKRGDLTGAESLWTEARPLFQRSLQAKDVAQVDTRFATMKQEAEETIARFNVPSTSFQYLSIENEAKDEDRVGTN